MLKIKARENKVHGTVRDLSVEVSTESFRDAGSEETLEAVKKTARSYGWDPYGRGGSEAPKQKGAFLVTQRFWFTDREPITEEATDA
jgi:hypothetical protein